jgi:hypothetical protein
LTRPIRDLALLPIACIGSLAVLDAIRAIVAADVAAGLAVVMVVAGAGLLASACVGWIRENWT